MNKVFKMVGGLTPPRSLFNNSHTALFDMDFGELIPVLGMEMLPGQSTEVEIESIVRMQPLVAPILHEVNGTIHLFFVPNRLLMDDKDHGWETFLTGGASGEETVALPLWDFTEDIENYGIPSKYYLADYFDIPVGTQIPSVDKPIGFLQRAYNFIFNEYYRDQNYMPEVLLTNNKILNRCWEKDYFTSALPAQQRGVAPAFPLSGTLPVEFANGYFMLNDNQGENFYPQVGTLVGNTYDVGRLMYNLGLRTNDNKLHLVGFAEDNTATYSMESNPIKGSVNLSGAATFNVSDLRLTVQVQKFLERNMRAGARYTEFLQAHFGVSPSDARLQRPEYVGGCKFPVVISEVMQTSATDDVSPQGNLAGKGLSADFSEVSRFTAPEFGYLVGIMSIMPRAMYSQGLDKKFSRKTRLDWPMPEFAHLSEQAVLNKEIFLSSDAETNAGVFGFQGIFNEVRASQSRVRGGMRDTLSYWHLGRIFANRPTMNAEFLQCDAERDGLKRCFAVQDEKGFVVYLGFNIRNTIPLPEIPEPGLVDHF